MLERAKITPVKQAELCRRFEMEILRVQEIRRVQVLGLLRERIMTIGSRKKLKRAGRLRICHGRCSVTSGLIERVRRNLITN